MYAPPTMPPGKVAGDTATAGLIETVYCRSPVKPLPSVARTVKGNMPAIIGVPESAFPVSISPGGSGPLIGARAKV